MPGAGLEMEPLIVVIDAKLLQASDVGEAAFDALTGAFKKEDERMTLRARGVCSRIPQSRTSLEVHIHLMVLYHF